MEPKTNDLSEEVIVDDQPVVLEYTEEELIDATTDIVKTEENDEAEREKVIKETENFEKASMAELYQARELAKQKMLQARDEKKKAKQELTSRIDLNDETAQVWDARIDEKVDGVANIIESQKEDILNDVFMNFAKDHPMSTKLAERVVEMYRALPNKSSGFVAESVYKDLMRAYAAESFDTNVAIDRKAAIFEAKGKLNSVGVTKSSSSGTAEIKKTITVPKEEYEYLKKSGMSDDAIKQSYKNKNK